MAPFCIFEETLKKLGQKLEANFADFSTLSPWLDVSILLLLTNRHNKGILLHFCQQNGKKIAKIKFWTKLAGNGLK